MKPVKTKNFFRKNEDKIVLVVGIILIALISFGAGRLTVTGGPKESIKIEDYGLASIKEPIETQNTDKETEEKDGLFVGSVNSNKYHLPDCTWAKRIKEENLIWFSSKEDAGNKGYIPANCLKREPH